MGEQLTLALVFGAGFLSFASPCILPLLPSFFSYVCGLSAQPEGEKQSWAERMRVLTHTAAFVVGLSTVFLGLGWSASIFGKMIFEYSRLLRWVGAVFIGLMGLKLLGVISLPMLDREWRLYPASSVGYLGSVFLGVAFAAGWTPCIGPILAGVLVLAGSQPHMAMAYLVAYTAGLAVPFLLSALFLSSWSAFRRYLHIVQPFAGIILVVFAILLATNWLTGLSTWLIAKMAAW